MAGGRVTAAGGTLGAMAESDECRVALLVPQDIGYGRGVLAGVQEVAAGRGWRLRQAAPVEAVLPLLRGWRPDGVIAHVTERPVAEALTTLGRPVVNTTTTLTTWEGPLVEVDHDAVGRLAAEHLLDRGYRHFGYLGSDWAGFSLARERAFRRRLAEGGHEVSACHLNYLPQPPADLPWDRAEEDLRSWVASLPKPCGVFASNDRPGRELVNVCRSLGVRVPRDVGVLGVDADDFECRMCEPPLSSVANPAAAIGRTAAEMLGRLMAGESVSEPRPLVAPPRVIVRGSTDAFATADSEVRAALRLIAERSCEGLRAADVHAASGVSRRQLERRFRDAVGRGVLEEITRVRVERAKQLLAETNLEVAVVAARSGFSGPRRMATVFAAEVGATPLGFRRSC